MSSQRSCMLLSAGIWPKEMRPDWTLLRSCEFCGYGISQINMYGVRSMTKQPVLSTIRKRRLQCFGHPKRMDNNRIPKRLYQWTPTHGKRRSGRLRSSRTTWKNVIIKRDLKKLGTEWSAEEAESAAQDLSVRKYLYSQAACAELHEADW